MLFVRLFFIFLHALGAQNIVGSFAVENLLMKGAVESIKI